MEKTGDDASTKFISALIKSLQTLCHGYLDFQNGIEIIGHINLSVDKGNSLDYILKEKVCKNAENSTLFISNSFHAEPKPDEEVSGKQGQAGNQSVNSEASMVEGSTKVSSAISSISSALTGVRDKRRESSGGKDFDSSYVHHRTSKRKASSDQNSDVCPAKMPSHHDVSHLSTDSPYRPNSSSPVDSKLSLQELQTADGEASETMLPQTASVTDNTDLGVNLAGSVLEPVENQSSSDLAARDEDSDGDLEVTFIKEEYVEGDRSCEFDNPSQQYVGGPHDRNSEGMPDPSVFPVALHSGTASSTYVPSTHDPGAVGQQYQGGVPSQPQPGPSGTRGNVSQQQAAQPLPPGTRPGCGYVHPADAQKWRMYELIPGSGVYIHQENYHTVMSKERDGQPDGKAMARYLMSCFWKQSELVGASIAEPPRPHHRSLDRRIINAILELCHFLSGESKPEIRKSMWWRISAANCEQRRKEGVQHIQFCRVLTGCSKRDVQRAMWWKISAANNAEKKRAGLSDLHLVQGAVGDMQAMLNVLPVGRGMSQAYGSGRAASRALPSTAQDAAPFSHVPQPSHPTGYGK